MASFISATEKSGDLFGEVPIRGNDPVIKHRLPPELTTAHMLCRQLKHKQTRANKKRIVHLICLNLQTLLRSSVMRTENSELYLISNVLGSVGNFAVAADRWSWR